VESINLEFTQWFWWPIAYLIIVAVRWENQSLCVSRALLQSGYTLWQDLRCPRG
jgi:hypothetical protein